MGPEGDYLLPSSAEIKNEWTCGSTPLYTFVAWAGIDFKIIIIIIIIIIN